jgi:hypothetical protein
MTTNPNESQANPPESQGIPATTAAAPPELADKHQVGLGHVVLIRHPRPRLDPGCSAVTVAIFNGQND